MTSEPNQIPQSSALAEADTDSLAEVMSRDPEGLQRQDRNRIVLALREMRARFEKSEAEAPSRAKAKGTVSMKQTASQSNAEDLGL